MTSCQRGTASRLTRQRGFLMACLTGDTMAVVDTKEYVRHMPTKWAIAALDKELSILANLPENEQGRKIGKPNSLFSICLLKISSIAKGDGMSYGQALAAITAACCWYNWLRDTEIERQFYRAWKKATPRRPSPALASSGLQSPQNEIISNPTKQAAPVSVSLYETDWYGSRSRLSRKLEGVPAEKTIRLIADVRNVLTTGELPKNTNYKLSITESEKWSLNEYLELRLSFSRCTKTLIEIVDFLALYFYGFIEDRFGAEFLIIISGVVPPNIE